MGDFFGNVFRTINLERLILAGGNIILLHIHRHDIHMSAFNLSDNHRSWDLKLLRGAQRYGRDGDLFFMLDNADRFTLFSHQREGTL